MKSLSTIITASWMLSSLACTQPASPEGNCDQGACDQLPKTKHDQHINEQDPDKPFIVRNLPTTFLANPTVLKTQLGLNVASDAIRFDPMRFKALADPSLQEEITIHIDLRDDEGLEAKNFGFQLEVRNAGQKDFSTIDPIDTENVRAKDQDWRWKFSQLSMIFQSDGNVVLDGQVTKVTNAILGLSNNRETKHVRFEHSYLKHDQQFQILATPLWALGDFEWNFNERRFEVMVNLGLETSSDQVDDTIRSELNAAELDELHLCLKFGAPSDHPKYLALRHDGGSESRADTGTYHWVGVVEEDSQTRRVITGDYSYDDDELMLQPIKSSVYDANNELLRAGSTAATSFEFSFSRFEPRLWFGSENYEVRKSDGGCVSTQVDW